MLLHSCVLWHFTLSTVRSEPLTLMHHKAYAGELLLRQAATSLPANPLLHGTNYSMSDLQQSNVEAPAAEPTDLVPKT